MLQHMFATMNELLDEIIQQYPSAEGTTKQELEHQMSLLRSMSDHIVEEWLRFEEKLALVRAERSAGNQVPATVSNQNPPSEDSELPDYNDPLQYGQGYFTLRMYEQASRHLEQAISRHPDKLIARVYLGLSYLHLGRNQEACRHFHFIIPLTEDAKLKALAYNALGCIQALHRNTEKAQHYFQKAHFADPTIPEPIANLKVCIHNHGVLQYGEKRMAHMS
ncbi:hypothetical protein MH117_03595 [Paenibacillus sp. ACRRX]|uniref:hypothetical protein n=1 Tax=unclassified Paenibacillus TaxID=185978 RepID=UPI001EF50545|nr:hypothetical protein [Paenibacillus sp. UMB4589-SE434]MCG7406489.1 hypothetical protein [Paenibacillus sp. ACRRX]MDK8179521.1 hypothetical protein [Paenibacillus sp. UMB4589-SE434]